MDDVLRFLIIFTLVLICVVGVLWMVGSSCAAGFASTHSKKLPYIIKGAVGQLEDTIQDVGDRIGKEYGEVKDDLGDIADAVRGDARRASGDLRHDVRRAVGDLRHDVGHVVSAARHHVTRR